MKSYKKAYTISPTTARKRDFNFLLETRFELVTKNGRKEKESFLFLSITQSGTQIIYDIADINEMKMSVFFPQELLHFQFQQNKLPRPTAFTKTSAIARRESLASATTRREPPSRLAHLRLPSARQSLAAGQA